MQKNQRKKILIIVNGGLPIPSIKGGAIETLINMVVDSNEKLQKYDITVCSNYVSGIEKYAKNYKNSNFIYFNINSLKYKISYLFRGILRRVFKLNIDSAYAAMFLKKMKSSINNYDLILVENYISCIHPISKIYSGKIVTRLHNNNIINAKYLDGATVIDDCYRVFAISDFIKKSVKSVKENDKTVITYNGINQANFKPNLKDKYEYRKKYNFKDDEIVFLFSGRVCEEKGVLALVHAFEKVCKKYDNCKLLIVGASFYSSTMKTKFIKKLKKDSKNIINKIIFTGYVDYKDMPKIYQLADVLVVPSLFEEAFGLTLVEGMSSKLPVIVSDSGGMPEIVTPENSFIAKRSNIEEELEKYMLKLVNDKKLREKMGEASFKRAKQFSEENYLENFWNAIDEILK